MMARKRMQRQSLRFVVVFLIAFISDIVVSGPVTPLRRRGRWYLGIIYSKSFFFLYLLIKMHVHDELMCCKGQSLEFIDVSPTFQEYLPDGTDKYIKHGCFLCFSEMQKGTLIVKSVMWHSNISIASPWEMFQTLKSTGGNKMQRSKARTHVSSTRFPIMWIPVQHSSITAHADSHIWLHCHYAAWL